MKRVRQETAESYEVTAVEVALALGLFVEEGDTVVLSHQYGDNYRIKVTSITEETIPLEAPVYDPILEAYGRAYVDEALSQGIVIHLLDDDPQDDRTCKDQPCCAPEAEAAEVETG